MTREHKRLPAGLWPDDALPPRIVVCERTGWWAVVVRRELGPADRRVHEVRSLDDAGAMLARAPGSFAVVELAVGCIEPVFDWLVRLPRDFPWTRAAVVADRALAGCGDLLRQAGAVHFVASPRQVRPLVEMAARHLAALPAPAGLAQQVWASLPWGRNR